MQTYRCAYQELVELNQLQPNPKNPNKHSAEQIQRLAKIIEYQGQRSPIVVSKRSGLITKGHGRLEALKKLGWEKAAVDFQDYDSDEQEYADIVADNAVAEWAFLDLSLVNGELPELGPDFDIDLLGIENFTLDYSEGLSLDAVKTGIQDFQREGEVSKNIVLVFSEDEYQHFIMRSEEMFEKYNIDNFKDLFLYLLK